MSLYQRFVAAAGHHHRRPAVIGDQGTLTYAELAAAAVGVATEVQATDGAPGDRVGLLLDHGVAMVAAILGTLGAGRCYVPLDPSWPAPRLAQMCSQADVSAMITSADHVELAARLSGAAAVRIDDLGTVATSTDRALQATAAVDVPATAPAYLLYTSGSTGQPKGVVQSHRNVLHGVGNHVTNLRITAADRLSLLTSFSFDMAVTDLYAAVLSGAAVVTIDVRRHGLGHLVAALAERRVSILHATPTVFRYLVDTLCSTDPVGRLPDLRVVVLGGEEVTAGDVAAARRHFAADCVLVNGYGATEVSFAVQNHLRPDTPLPAGVVPIGRPLAGYDVVLLEPGADHPADGVGEIAVRSEYLALGYWRDPQRTAERFVDLTDDPTGVRQYRTGDLGRWLPDGTLVCLGRADRQVKLRGYRVEPGEVEAQLEALPGVARAVAVVRGEALVGYVQPATARPGPLDPAEIRTALAQRLPDYLVPAAIVLCERLPLTPTGKVDLLALPEPPTTAAAAPGSPTEHLLHEAWCAVLGVTTVGVTDSFFDLGGHSLLLAGVQQRIEAQRGVRVPLLTLLQLPTIRDQAGCLDAMARPIGLAADPGPDVTGARRRMTQRRHRMTGRAKREDH